MKISIENIENSKNRQMNILFDEFIEEIPTKSSIKADLVLTDLMQSINVVGVINADLILECNRCLQDFVLEQKIEVNETYYKEKLFSEYKNERELKTGCFAEDLNGQNEIDITDLIYQSVILSIPNQCVCDINCKGENIDLEKYMKPENSN